MRLSGSLKSPTASRRRLRELRRTRCSGVFVIQSFLNLCMECRKRELRRRRTDATRLLRRRPFCKGALCSLERGARVVLSSSERFEELGERMANRLFALQLYAVTDEAYYVSMKRLAMAALGLIWFALPVCAQHAAAHGGFSGHSAGVSHSGPAFHSAPSAPVSRGFSGHPGYGPSNAMGRPSNMVRRPMGAPQGSWISRSGARPPYLGGSQFRRPYISNYRPAYRYGAPFWIAPYYLAFPGDFGDDSTATPDNTVAEGYDQQPDQPEDQELPPWPGVPYAAPPSQANTEPASDSENGVTLIFKDGRPPELIQNYVLTQDTLFVGDRYHRRIPLEQLDLTATVQVNRDLGSDFRLPNGSR